MTKFLPVCRLQTAGGAIGPRIEMVEFMKRRAMIPINDPFTDLWISCGTGRPDDRSPSYPPATDALAQKVHLHTPSSYPLTTKSMPYNRTRQHVHNRGIPPVAFLDELVAWGRTAPDEIFAPNALSDIYSNILNTLGPWEGIPHRRAVMLEVLRVLGGFESSWDWNEGRDVSNPQSDTPEEIEAGIFQVSANSMNFGQELRDLLLNRVGSLDPIRFQAAMKADHALAMEYTARLLRRTVRHHGPVRDHYIDAWLRRDAVAEFQTLLADGSVSPLGQANAGGGSANNLGGAGAPGPAPSPHGGYAAAVSQLATQQYESYNDDNETDPQLRTQIRRYWTELGFQFPGVATPWSAVFVSWVMRTAGASATEFKASTAHSRFVFWSIRNKQNNTGHFWGHRLATYAPKVGDIIQNNRGNQTIDYDFAAAHEAYQSHSAIIVNLGSDSNGRFAITVGGNEGDTVGRKRVALDSQGHVVQRDSNPFICVIENRKA